MIYFKSLDRMAAFYGNALNLPPRDDTRTDVCVEFGLETTTLALHAIPSDIADKIQTASPVISRDETPVKLIFEVEDVHGECCRLESMGAAILQRPWGTCDVSTRREMSFKLLPRTKYTVVIDCLAWRVHFLGDPC